MFVFFHLMEHDDQSLVLVIEDCCPKKESTCLFIPGTEGHLALMCACACAQCPPKSPSYISAPYFPESNAWCTNRLMHGRGTKNEHKQHNWSVPGFRLRPQGNSYHGSRRKHWCSMLRKVGAWLRPITEARAITAATRPTLECQIFNLLWLKEGQINELLTIYRQESC